MVAPKGDVTEDTWCKISRGIDGIEAICDGVSEKLKADQKESYRLHENYQEIVHWRAVLRSSGIVCNFQEMGVVKNIYGETLSENMYSLYGNVTEKMESFWKQVEEGKLPNEASVNVLSVFPDEEFRNLIDSDESDSE